MGAQGDIAGRPAGTGVRASGAGQRRMADGALGLSVVSGRTAGLRRMPVGGEVVRPVGAAASIDFSINKCDAVPVW